MPISYMGVGGTKFSDAWGTQNYTISGGQKVAVSSCIGVDIIPGGGRGGEGGLGGSKRVNFGSILGHFWSILGGFGLKFGEWKIN